MVYIYSQRWRSKTSLYDIHHLRCSGPLWSRSKIAGRCIIELRNQFNIGSPRRSSTYIILLYNTIDYLLQSYTYIMLCIYMTMVFFPEHTHTHTQSYTYWYIYVQIFIFYCCHSRRTRLGHCFAPLGARKKHTQTTAQPQFKQVWARTCQLNRTPDMICTRYFTASRIHTLQYLYFIHIVAS